MYTTRMSSPSISSSDTAVLSPWGVSPTWDSGRPFSVPSTIRMAAPWLNMAMVFPSFSAATRFNAGM